VYQLTLCITLNSKQSIIDSYENTQWRSWCTLRPGAGNILAPLPSTKTTNFEVKNICKSAKEAKTEHLFLFVLFFEGNRTLQRGVRERSPQPSEANGVSGAEANGRTMMNLTFFTLMRK